MPVDMHFNYKVCAFQKTQWQWDVMWSGCRWKGVCECNSEAYLDLSHFTAFLEAVFNNKTHRWGPLGL